MRLYSIAFLVAVALLAKVDRATPSELTTADYPTLTHSITGRQNHVTPRLLRRMEEDDEERGIGGTAISDLAAKLKSRTSSLVDKAVNLKAREMKAARAMRFGEIEDTLASSNINYLITKVKEINDKNRLVKVSLLGTLTTKYGDDAVAAALVTAKRSADSPSVAQQIQKLQTEQLMKWKDSGKSLGSVSKLLNFRYNKGLGQKFQVLDEYAKLVKQSDDTLLTTLIKSVGGEDNLGGVLYGARTNSAATKNKATKLENILIERWTRGEQLPANVFQWLRLSGDVDDAFTANNLNRFMKYVDDFNAKNPGQKKPVLELYTQAFKDAPVMRKLLSAMDDSTTNVAAKKLLVERGVQKDNQSLGSMFRALNIDINQPTSIVNQKIDVLEQLAEVKEVRQVFIKALTAQVGGNKMLAKILEGAEAATLQKKQFATWIGEGVTPENFWKMIYKTETASNPVEEKIMAKFTAFYQSQKPGN
ncbi:hypothetical protein GN244_ATG03176 [Phytophthora infestans]|uniref:Secreted RxLR effector peptide protein n=1 Tax=Phytophthora infestans TaxID=4787 RepID=A0A833T6S8_PHYIN|nr:hypothetical protein GN244_ATG03176 [Phytophthora infestans]